MRDWRVKTMGKLTAKTVKIQPCPAPIKSATDYASSSRLPAENWALKFRIHGNRSQTGRELNQ